MKKKFATCLLYLDKIQIQRPDLEYAFGVHGTLKLYHLENVNMYTVDAYYNLFNYNSYNNFKVPFEKVFISRFSNGEREPNIDDGSNENR